jgi:hypothetical protein
LGHQALSSAMGQLLHASCTAAPGEEGEEGARGWEEEVGADPGRGLEAAAASRATAGLAANTAGEAGEVGDVGAAAAAAAHTLHPTAAAAAASAAPAAAAAAADTEEHDILPAEILAATPSDAAAAAAFAVALQVAFERQTLKPVFQLIGYRLWVF